MRHEVSRLCQTLQDRREEQRATALTTELKYLRACEAALDGWINHLSAERDHQADELTQVQREGVSLVLDPPRDRLLASDVSEAVSAERPHAVLHSCNAYESINPDEDVRLRHLVRQRELAAEELEATERQLRQSMDRLRDLESGGARLRDREIEAVRRDLHDLEGQIRNAEQRQRLEYEIGDLQSEISRLRGDTHNSAILDHAARILRRLTDNRIMGLRVENTRNVVVEFATGTPTADAELTRADRDDVYLSLCLALVSALRRQGTELPLLLDDVFGGDNTQRDHALATILHELSQQDQQIVVFTSHEQVFRHCSGRGAHLVPWGNLQQESVGENVVDHVRFKPRTGITNGGSRGFSNPSEGSRYDERREGDLWTHRSGTVGGDATSPDYLSRATDLVDVNLIDSHAVARLRRMGAVNVGDFLQMPPAEVHRELVRAGLTNRPVQQWQDQLGLQCAIRGLTAEDASRLVAAGVSSVAELAELQPEVLAARLRSEFAGADRSPSVKETEDDSVVAWIRAARLAYPDYRRRRGGEQRAENDRKVGRGDTVPKGSRVQLDWEDVNVSSRGKQKARRRRQTSASATEATSIPSRLRYYLNPDDPVVDAPSIGPRTAERLHKARIRTVADLLAIDPDDAEDRVDYARIKSDTIRDWQAQALLASSVPQLRGHDAQILVACDVRNADQLAATDADELWAKVRQFVKTAEGKRVLRNGKKPDVSEVRDWINWGTHARQLPSVEL